MTLAIQYVKIFWNLFLRIVRFGLIVLVFFDMIFNLVGFDTVINLLLVILVSIELKGEWVIKVTGCSCGHGADSNPVQPDRGSITKNEPMNGGGV